MAAICPECENPIAVDVDDVEEGETVHCDECGTELEITSLDPLELTPVEEAGYDEEQDTRPGDEDDD